MQLQRIPSSHTSVELAGRQANRLGVHVGAGACGWVEVEWCVLVKRELFARDEVEDIIRLLGLYFVKNTCT